MRLIKNRGAPDFSVPDGIEPKYILYVIRKKGDDIRMGSYFEKSQAEKGGKVFVELRIEGCVGYRVEEIKK